MDRQLPQSNKVDRTVAKALDVAGEAEDNFIRLSTGVVLEAMQANPNVLIRIMTAQPRPEPPVYFNKTMGREMENPDDPDYIKRVQAWEMNYNSGMLNALIGLGTKLHTLPKGMEGPYPKTAKRIQKVNGKETIVEEEIEPQWVRDYASLGLPIIHGSPSWYYITWVLFKAAVTDKDTNAIGEKVKRLSGVREADVKAAESFPESDEASR
jgi:hypothetical protein